MEVWPNLTPVPMRTGACTKACRCRDRGHGREGLGRTIDRALPQRARISDRGRSTASTAGSRRPPIGPHVEEGRQGRPEPAARAHRPLPQRGGVFDVDAFAFGHPAGVPGHRRRSCARPTAPTARPRHRRVRMERRKPSRSASIGASTEPQTPAAACDNSKTSSRPRLSTPSGRVTCGTGEFPSQSAPPSTRPDAWSVLAEAHHRTAWSAAPTGAEDRAVRPVRAGRCDQLGDYAARARRCGPWPSRRPR